MSPVAYFKTDISLDSETVYLSKWLVLVNLRKFGHFCLSVKFYQNLFHNLLK